MRGGGLDSVRKEGAVSNPIAFKRCPAALTDSNKNCTIGCGLEFAVEHGNVVPYSKYNKFWRNSFSVYRNLGLEAVSEA